MNAGLAAAGREVVDIRQVVERAVSQARGIAEGATIQTTVDDELPLLRGDGQALVRAVQNLVVNALKYAPGSWVRVCATRRDEFVRIVVEDRGPGVDPKEAAQVFEPFYRGAASRGFRGSGLGLAIVKQIVEQHGGSVSVERPGEGGAAFIIELPPAGAGP